MITIDYLIIGAGIVGITIALELKKRFPEAKIQLLEKEAELGMHSSGRNSGVLHSGIYYPAGTLKAEVCRQGAIEMKAFHREHKLRLRECGKLLVVADFQDTPQLAMLEERAQKQGIPVEKLDEQQLRDMEPQARSASGQALYVPSTAVGDSAAVMQVLREALKEKNIALTYNAQLASVEPGQRQVRLTSGEVVQYGHAINTAGLYADRVAHLFHCGQAYKLLPFKGIYWKLDPASGIDFKHLIYPVPDLRVPFLGVHTTTTVDGATYLGPTAVPAFGRENYAGLQGVKLTEAAQISLMLTKQFAANRDGFHRLAWQEGRRYFKRWFVQAAQAIVPSIKPEHLQATSKVGIRAQMFNMQKGKLENDFLIEQGENSTHILNAISPAWTSAFPFARHVCDHHIP
jgi:(S)-2-hydroxyglutarate dehydrogenase